MTYLKSAAFTGNEVRYSDCRSTNTFLKNSMAAHVEPVKIGQEDENTFVEPEIRSKCFIYLSIIPQQWGQRGAKKKKIVNAFQCVDSST